MRPRMAALIIVFGLLLLTSPVDAQTVSTVSSKTSVSRSNTAPQSFPPESQIQQVSGTLEAPASQFQVPINASAAPDPWAPTRHKQTIQLTGHSEAWPSHATPSRLSEPVAAPPAKPLPVAPTPSGERQFRTSEPHILTVQEPSVPAQEPQLNEAEIPSVPPVLDGSQTAAYHPQSTADIPAAPSEDTAWQPPPPGSDPVMEATQPMTTGQVFEPYADQWNDTPLMEEGRYDAIGYDNYAYCEESPSYRNMNFPDICQEPDICGEFVPFGNLGLRAGNDRVVTDGGFFIPLWQNCDTLFYTDLRGSIDDHDSGNGFFGLGYRTFMDPLWIFGAYVYADLIATNQDNAFGQANLGLELMSLNWEFRFNGFVPASDQSANTVSGISNGTVVTRNSRERANPGWQFEIGHRWLYWGWNDRYEVRWFVGGYDFDGASGFPDFGGPFGRLEMRIFDLPWCGQQSRLEFGAEASYDRVRDGQIWGFVRVRIPFGPKQGRPALDPMRRRMVDLQDIRVY